jgi:hypothetical protein
MAQQGTWDVEEAARRIAKGSVKSLDICEVNTCGETVASLNTICFGLTGVIGIIAACISSILASNVAQPPRDPNRTNKNRPIITVFIYISL